MSPLAHELDSARAQGTRDVVDLAARRHRKVRATHLPDRASRPMLDAAGAAGHAASLLVMAHEADDFPTAQDDAITEALALLRKAVDALGAIAPRGGR